jgi:integral membrane protein
MTEPRHEYDTTATTTAGRAGDEPAVRWFRAVAVVEALSYLVLVAASIAKRLPDGVDLVPVIGPVHGVIFLVYLVLALTVREHQGWHLSTTLLVIVAAVIPLGGIYVERRLVHATG